MQLSTHRDAHRPFLKPVYPKGIRTGRRGGKTALQILSNRDHVAKSIADQSSNGGYEEPRLALR